MNIYLSHTTLEYLTLYNYFFLYLPGTILTSTTNTTYTWVLGSSAMGTNVAPSYANIFKDRFERNHVYSYNSKPGRAT